MIIELFKTCKISLSLNGLDDEISENDDISDESNDDIVDESGDDIVSNDDIASDDDIVNDGDSDKEK